MSSYSPPGLAPLFSPKALADRVLQMGDQIAKDYGAVLEPRESLLVIGVLNGAFIFMADLVRAINLPLEIDFIRLSSYQDQTESSAHVVMLKSLEMEVKNRHVLVVEDIADYGLTLAWLLDFLRQKGPKSLKLAVAINKNERRKVNLAIDYVGFEVQEGFLVGYGLDYAQNYRHLPGVHKLKAN
ncbi:MAG: hypoxanthine phosphoribosyltransferase [Deltaproteobacteria bacterium]|jgi:hypoxanthine phosphoribosyltransferase|nr:hypoxanthine phosphoribosyltransferase [Deltaproteobacteria bacterium]